VGLECGHKELGGGTKLLDLLSYALAVLGVKSTVELVHNVKRSCFNLLDGKDKASGDYSFLASREAREG
jgi:hypothetical protein